MEWYCSIENLQQLAQYLIDRDGPESLDASYFLEKPWKWENEWKQYQKELAGKKEQQANEIQECGNWQD